MSLPDFQLAFAKLIASPQLCEKTIVDEEPLFAQYDLSEKEKKRLHAVLRQKGMSTCCSLYRMNRITPLYTQLSNTSQLLNDDLVPLVEEFWLQRTYTSLQFKEEVLAFGQFLMQKIEAGAVSIDYLKEVLQLEMAINELSYLPEGTKRVLKFDHDIYQILLLLSNGELTNNAIAPATLQYEVFLQNQTLQMEAVA